MSLIQSKNKEKKVIIMVNDKDACNISCTKCYLQYEGVRSPDSAEELAKNSMMKDF